jgi:uncharacterized lipoprotein
MEKNMKVIVSVFVIIGFLTGCSAIGERFPDRSKEYQQAETLPDLEIPPDLTAGAINDRMAIPGEAGNRAGSGAGSRASNSASSSANTSSGSSRATPSPQATSGNDPELAVIQSINNNKPLLSIPEEFTQAWVDVERILQNAEIKIDEQDQSTGIFKVNYSPDGQSGQRSLFTIIKTWDWKTSAGRDYQLSLTGVGDKTEVVVLDMEGEWVADEGSRTLLATVRDHYNLNRSQ